MTALATFQADGYFPGFEPIVMKLRSAPDTGKLLGAEAVGHQGVDKRVGVLATAVDGDGRSRPHGFVSYLAKRPAHMN